MPVRTEEIKRPLCGCGTPVMWRGKTVLGFNIWKSGCSACQKRAIRKRKDRCEKCGTTTKLTVDHKDRDRSNNDPDNLQTLCSHCHIIKSRLNGDYSRS